MIDETEIRECMCGREFEVVIKYVRPWTVCPHCMQIGIQPVGTIWANHHGDTE